MILRTKILFVVAIVLMVFIGISTTVALNLQTKRIISAKLKDVEILSNIIHRSIEDNMAAGNVEEVQRSLENIGRNPEIISLRIISNDGYILKSKIPEEIGLKSKNHAAVKFSNDRYKPLIRENSITHLFAIPNKKECYGCHNKNIKVNGIIEIDYDVSRSKGDILAIKRFLIFSNILTVFIIVGILGFMFTRLIMDPLRVFLSTIRAVEGGDWDARVLVKGNDELSTIGKAFNNMLDEVRKLYNKSLTKEKEISKVKMELDHKAMLEDLNTQLQHKIKEVETANKAVLSLSKEVKTKNIELEIIVERLKNINEVGRILASIIEPDELLRIIIKTTSEMVNVQRGSIFIKKGDQQPIIYQYRNGIGVSREESVPAGHESYYKEFFAEGKHLLKEPPHDAESAEASLSIIGVPLSMKGQIIGGLLLEEKIGEEKFNTDEIDLLATMANQTMVAVENAWLYATVKSNYFGTIQALVNALEASDRYTKGHSERVKSLGLELARYIGLDYKELEVFEHAAILHDIGKIGIDSAVLNKEGALTNVEFSLIKAHPIIGDEILGPIGTLQGVRTTILQHHERYDGAGYPYGIAGDEISLKARILSVVDTFDAMLKDRPYRKALTYQKALDELKRNAGTQFDPVVVNAFIEMIETGEEVLVRSGYGFVAGLRVRVPRNGAAIN